MEEEMSLITSDTMIILETKRLLLRPFISSDADTLKRVFQDPEVMRFGDGIQTPLWIRNWIHLNIETYKNRPGWGALAIIEKINAELIGYCGLFFFKDICGQPESEIGYRLVRTAWKKGYATEAVMAMSEHALGFLKRSRVISIIDPNNIASIRVAEKVGMRYEKEVMREGYDYPDHVYVISRQHDT